MVKIFITLLALLLLIAGYIAHPILAGGDKNGGEIGTGDVIQNTNTTFDGTCPYDNCPPLVVTE